MRLKVGRHGLYSPSCFMDVSLRFGPRTRAVPGKLSVCPSFTFASKVFLPRVQGLAQSVQYFVAISRKNISLITPRD